MTEKYYLDNEQKEFVLCQDLTYGYVVGVEDGSIEDTKINAIIDSTGQSEEYIFKLRKHQVDDIFNIIIKLTYPELHNEDGTRIEVVEEDEGKKKV